MYEAISTVRTRPFGAGVDPHFFTDPASMADAAAGIADHLVVSVPVLDTDVVRRRVDAYLRELRELDDEVEATLAPIPDEHRVLVTNHDVFGYFADRYGFEVVGVVVPGGGTSGGVSGGAWRIWPR